MYKQKYFIKRLQSIQLITAAELRQPLQAELMPDTHTVMASIRIDEQPGSNKAALLKYRRQLSAMLAEKMLSQELLRFQLLTEKDVDGTELPLWEAVLVAEVELLHP